MDKCLAIIWCLLASQIQSAAPLPNCVGINDHSDQFFANSGHPSSNPVCFCDRFLPVSADLYKDQPLIQISCGHSAVLQNLTDAIEAVVAADFRVGIVWLDDMDYGQGIPKSFFSEMPVADTLSMEMNGCSLNRKLNGQVKVAEGAFDGLEASLVHLDLSDCRIESALPELRRMTNLSSLRLPVFDKDQLNKSHLNGLSQVTELHIDVASVQADVFESMTSLRNLTVGHRKNVPVGLLAAVSQLDQLQSLTMNDVGLTELKDDQRSGLKSLTNLSLNRNYIENISLAAFNGLENLQLLDLRANMFDKLEPGLFAPLKNLQKLLLAGNFLSEFNANLHNISDTLTELHIGFNEISNIGADSFSSLPNLEILNMSSGLAYTRLSSIHVDAFAGLGQLKVLAMANGDFAGPEGLPRDLFKPLSALETLDLSNCELQKISDGQLKPLSNLKRLSLKSNNLRVFPKMELAGLGNLEILDLSQNPWLCDDQFQANVLNFVKQLKDMGANFTLVNSRRILCDRPYRLRNRQVLSLKDTEWQPYDVIEDTTTQEPTTSTTGARISIMTTNSADGKNLFTGSNEESNFDRLLGILNSFWKKLKDIFA